MELHLHPDMSVQKLAIGEERAPLLVIDNFVAGAEQLIDAACRRRFIIGARMFPGVRAKAPLLYQRFLVEKLQSMLFEYFQLRGNTLSFSMCHYSLVTTPAAELAPRQRIPHIDSVNGNGLATIHYLFRGALGGTAFYRHRKTGYEFVDAARQAEYLSALDGEINGDSAPVAAYINGDTELFERVALEDGVFNRLLIYRRNSLHSGSIEANFVPDPNPLTGRLSINSFIDVQ